MLGTAEVMRVFFIFLLFYRPTSSAFEILVGSEFFFPAAISFSSFFVQGQLAPVKRAQERKSVDSYV